MQFLKLSRNLGFKWTSQIHTCAPVNAGKMWRSRNRMPPIFKEEGRSIQAYDWTYVDGRETKMNPGRARLALLQIQVCKRIMKLTKEVDFIVDDYNKSVEEAKTKRQTLMDSKLKAKGGIAVK